MTASRIAAAVDRASADAAHAEITAFTQSRHPNVVNKQFDKVLSLNGFLNEMPKTQVLVTDFLEVRTAFQSFLQVHSLTFYRTRARN
jgi:hypothetical protein